MSNANKSIAKLVDEDNVVSNVEEVDFEEIEPKKPKKFFSKSIFLLSLKRNWKMLLIITAFMSFYMFSYMFACKDMAVYADMPEFAGSSPISLIAMGFFGMMGIIFIFIYNITVGNKLIASEVDKGSMSFSLNTPITRLQIVVTKAIYFVLSIGVMIGVVSLVGVAFAEIFKVSIDYSIYYKLVLGYFLYSFAVAGICYLASCWFNKSAHSLMVGAGLPIFFLVASSVASIDDKFKFLKFLSLNSLYDTTKILANSNYVIQFIAMAVIGIACFVAGIVKFNTKDLPL